MDNIRFLGRYILIPVIFIVLLLGFYLIYKDIRTRTIKEFSNEQLILAQTAARGMSSFFTEFQSDLEFLASFDGIISISGETETLLNKFYEVQKGNISAVTRVDSNGIIRFTSPQNPAVIGRDITYQEHVRKILATHQPVISDVFVAAQGYSAIAIHVPVFRNNVFQGSLALLIPIDRLGEIYLANMKVRGNGEVWLLSENGISLYCAVADHKGKPFLESNDSSARSGEFLDQIRTQVSGTALIDHHTSTERDGKDEKFVTFYRMPIGNTYWTILISCKEKTIYESLTKLNNRLILLFLVFLIIISFYIFSIVKARNVLREEAKRIKAEKTLRESEEKFRRIFEDHSAIKLLIDPGNGSIIDANHSAARYYGWSRDELRTMNISDINLLSFDEIKENILRVMNTNKQQFEFKHRLKDGSLRDIEVYSSKIRIGDRDLLHSIIHDITDRKQVEHELILSKERAEESDRLKTAFLQNMSHEIRTPMNAIMGFSSLIADYYDDRNKLTKFGEIIKSRCNDLLEIINGILDISKIESGQFSVRNEKCNLIEFFEDLSKFFEELQVRLGKQNIRFILRSDIPATKTDIVTDKVKLRQIFINLVSNAFKFTNEGLIEAGCTLNENDEIVFFVSDTGIGIPAEKHEMVFQRFVQIHRADDYAYGGTGLGLAIVKGLIELLKGKIWFESEEAKGTTFYFQISERIES